MSCYRFEVAYFPEYHPEFHLLRQLKKDLAGEKFLFECRRVFFAKFSSGLAEESELYDFAREILVDPVTEHLIENYSKDIEHVKKVFGKEFARDRLFSADISFRSGVTDNSALAFKEALNLAGFTPEVVASGTSYILSYENQEQKEKLRQWFESRAYNPLIQEFSLCPYEQREGLFTSPELKNVELEGDLTVEDISLEGTDEQLRSLSESRHLALTLKEMRSLQEYYERDDVQKVRKERHLPSAPTDVELEVFAQSWSEHCKHKIFAADIDYREKNGGTYSLGEQTVNSLYKTCIKKVTRDLEEKGLNWTLSVFHDNAGVVDFDSKLSLAIKVETHNSPSALDPYGGALTGILGVNRDILGCGMGYRPIANTDVFCFGPAHWPEDAYKDYMPQGLMEPSRIFSGVHKGVEDGGNKSGIPTVNGAIFFDPDYSGKPLVFCGTVGVAPKKLPAGIPSHEKRIKSGDQIVVVGGAVGADGIHGATFSSLELNESSPTSAVQIGDPLMQRRVTDFLEDAKNENLYTSLTDNGAGGLSSSVGEMAFQPERNVCGARLDLAKCPLKYPGLKPFEILISESQERMTLSVDADNLEELRALAKRRNVPFATIGEFNQSGFFEVDYGDKLVGLIDLHMLHEGLPKMELKAHWEGPEFERQDWYPVTDFSMNQTKRDLYSKLLPDSLLEKKWVESFATDILSRGNVASKENWVRRYDHEVQAATITKPFSQGRGNSPSDSGKLWLEPHGGEEKNAITLGCGLAPRLSRFDPYWMAVASVDEAVRNVLSEGGDPDALCLLDNFCWPDPIASKKNPRGEHKLGQLVRCNFGLRDIATIYGLPLVSGKDSMKNDFRGKNKRGEDLSISIQPTLLVTAMARSHVSISPFSFFTTSGEEIFLLKPSASYLLGSEAFEMLKFPKEHVEGELKERNWAKELENLSSFYRRLYQGFKEGVINSCHDVSEGGPFVSLSEMTFAQNLGADITLPKDWQLRELFGEGLGQFIVTVSPQNRDFLDSLLPEALPLGKTGGETLTMTQGEKLVFQRAVSDLEQTWSKSLEEVMQ